MFVYIISEPRKKCVKIGVAADVEARLYDLQCGSAYKLKIADKFRAENRAHAYYIEATVHRMLKRHRVSGEWFAVSAADAVVAVTSAITKRRPAPQEGPFFGVKVTCPTCKRWRVIPTLIADSRKMRCRKCNTLILPRVSYPR